MSGRRRWCGWTEYRAHQIALAVAGEPLRQLPLLLAHIPEVDPFKPIPRLQRMVIRYNTDQFDRLTKRGYRLNLLKEVYEKIHD